jgi:hypothetical protein
MELFREGLVIHKMIQSIIMKYVYRYITLDKVAFGLMLIINIAYLIIISSVIYIFIITFFILKKRKIILYRKWFLVPLILSIIIIYSFSISLIPAILETTLYAMMRSY